MAPGTDSVRVRARARLRDQRGLTLYELVATMGISLVIGAAALMAIQTGERSSAKTTARQEAVQAAEVALAHITKEVRLAPVVAVRSASFLDLKTYVRVNGGANQLRRVQYDCTNLSACTRRDCGSIALSGSLMSLSETCAGTATDVIRGLDQIAFGAEAAGAALSLPREALGATPVFDYVPVRMRVRLDDSTAGRRHVPGTPPVELQGGVKLENVGTP